MAGTGPEYSIWIVEYARVKQYPVGGVLYGHYNSGTLVLPYCYGVLKSDEHVILVDTGFDYAEFGRVLAEMYGVSDWQPPSVVLPRIGIQPADVDAVILTHNHFDHAGNVDAFPNATVYIQGEEVRKFLWAKSLPERLQWLTTACDPDDLMELMRRWTERKLVLVEGDAEVLPGVHVFAAHETHTLGSQFVLVDDGRGGRWVLSGDNVYVYESLEGIGGDGRFVPPGLIFGSTMRTLLTMEKMHELAGRDVLHVLPFHEVRLWERFPSKTYPDGLHVAAITVRAQDRAAGAA